MADTETSAATQICRPAIGFTLKDGIIVVQVGAARTKYYYHKALISHHSKFFAKALTGSWREAREGVVTLEDIEPAIFNIYMYWLYNQEVPPAEEDDNWNAIMEVSDSTYLEDMTSKIKAYVLADRFLDTNFRKEMSRAIVTQLHYFSGPTDDIPGYVFLAFENIPADRPILQLMVNDYCHYWSQYASHEVHVRALKQMPLAFTYRTVLRFRELAHSHAKDHVKACYLEHESKDEISACDKLYHVCYKEEEDYGYLYNLKDMLSEMKI